MGQIRGRLSAKASAKERSIKVSIMLNGEPRSVPSGCSVARLLKSLDLAPGTVVVERNRRILARDALGAVGVEEGDKIEIVHFVGGG